MVLRTMETAICNQSKERVDFIPYITAFPSSISGNNAVQIVVLARPMVTGKVPKPAIDGDAAFADYFVRPGRDIR